MKRHYTKIPAFPRGLPRWHQHTNRLPDGTVSSKSFRVSWYEDGKRLRRNFPTCEEAEDFTATLQKKQLENEHGLATQVTTLSKAQLAAAERAFAILQLANFYDQREPDSADCMVKAADWFVENYQTLAVEIPTVVTAIPLFLATREGRSPRTTRSHDGYLREFAATHGGMLVAAITPTMVATYLDAVKTGPVAKLHRWDTLHAFFAFCAGKKNVAGAWIGTNPLKQVPEPVHTQSTPQIYTVKETRRLIQASLDRGYAMNVVIRLFSMVREEEMERMIRHPESVWHFIQLSTGQIRLDAAVVKTRADKKRGGRRIDILPVLAKWLHAFRKRNWTAWLNRSVYEQIRRDVDPQKLGRGSGYHNMVRHTAISFRAAIEPSIFSVAEQAGSSEAIIRQAYLQRVSKQDGKAFFALSPDKFHWPKEPPRPPSRRG